MQLLSTIKSEASECAVEILSAKPYRKSFSLCIQWVWRREWSNQIPETPINLIASKFLWITNLSLFTSESLQEFLQDSIFSPPFTESNFKFAIATHEKQIYGIKSSWIRNMFRAFALPATLCRHHLWIYKSRKIKQSNWV